MLSVGILVVRVRVGVGFGTAPLLLFTPPQYKKEKEALT